MLSSTRPIFLWSGLYVQQESKQSAIKLEKQVQSYIYHHITRYKISITWQVRKLYLTGEKRQVPDTSQQVADSHFLSDSIRETFFKLIPDICM